MLKFFRRKDKRAKEEDEGSADYPPNQSVESLQEGSGMDMEKRLRLSQVLYQFREVGDERVALIEKKLAALGGPLPEKEVRAWQSKVVKRQYSQSSPVEERHESIKGYFDNEAELRKKFGDGIITVEVSRANLEATSIKDLQGEMLTEILYPAGVISGDDSVSIFERLVRIRLAELAPDQPALHLSDQDEVTFFLSGRPMNPDSLFYADNFILLPVWVQCGLHACGREVLLQRLKELSR